MPSGMRAFFIVAFLGTLGAIIAGIGWSTMSEERRVPPPTAKRSDVPNDALKKPARVRAQKENNLTLFWDGFPEAMQALRQDTGESSNIHAEDYTGPESCKNCHKKQYEGWSEHPHRWMNARVQDSPIKGDFADRKVAYLGGEIRFTKVDDAYHMQFERGDVKRDYLIDQTIGSRFFQYYVGKQLTGPEPTEHPLYAESHVLPFGYWIDRNEWIPIVHVFDDFEDKTRHDPFAVIPSAPEDSNLPAYAGKTQNLYRAQCNYCHTTFPLGDMLVRSHKLMGDYVPVNLNFSLPDYLSKARPSLWPAEMVSRDVPEDAYKQLLKEFKFSDARDHAVTLGVSCEACHLGAKEHAQGKRKKPDFFPHSPELAIRAGEHPHDLGRTHDNINWACGRCHSGVRQPYAAGMATWNSTEYSDAVRGKCYSELMCVKCHNPHEALGSTWKNTPAQDDAICLSCHKKYEASDSRMAHTHHANDSDGARCMNCHMPRINEGLQEVVRTHTIFSPTNKAMIEANQMNACNQCHVEKNIDWTVAHLQDWYGTKFDGKKIAANYPQRDLPATINWLRGKNENVRLVAADSLARAKAAWAMPDLLKSLDDPFMLNRQFTRIGLEAMLGIKLSSFGYEFFMTADERKEPIQKMVEKLVPAESQANRSNP